MGYLYAISDIHGKYDLLQQALSVMDLDPSENQLYLLGDYIDRGEESLATISLVKQLSEEKPKQIFPLLGNHELMLLTDLEENFPTNETMTRLMSMLTADEQQEVDFSKDNGVNTFPKLIQLVKAQRKELFRWIENLPLYLETKHQIFVHAGIEEVEDWKMQTDPHTMLWLRSYKTGKFYKDIVMGHTPTSVIVSDLSFHGIFWDGESHFYIDGHAYRVNQLQILRYDTSNRCYAYYCHESQYYIPLKAYAPPNELT